MKNIRIALVLLAAVVLGACASLPEPPLVSVVGVEPLQGEGLELRLLLKLRVQNPNSVQLAYKGATARLEVRGRLFASGVTNSAGTLEPLSETVVTMPVSISAFNMLRQALGLLDGQPIDKLPYSMSGTVLTSSRTLRFHSTGELELPAGLGTGR
jgi:LEA14-like dessication related protein